MGPAPDGDPSLWNDHELDPIVRWAWGRGIVPRFIELMDGAARKLRASPVSRDQMLARLAVLLADGPGARPEGRGPAGVFPSRATGAVAGWASSPGARGPSGADCDRLRVTSDGRLRPCLASSRAFSIAEALRAGSARDAAAVVETAWRARPDASAWRGCAEEGAAEVSMRVTGG